KGLELVECIDLLDLLRIAGVQRTPNWRRCLPHGERASDDWEPRIGRATLHRAYVGSVLAGCRILTTPKPWATTGTLPEGIAATLSERIACRPCLTALALNQDIGDRSGL